MSNKYIDSSNVSFKNLAQSNNTTPEATTPIIPFTIGSLISHTMQLATDRAKAAQKNGGIVGIPSHIRTLNKILGGYQQGLHIVSGEPGAGKTSFLLQTAIHAAKAGFPVIFLSFEELTERLALKVICQQGNLIPKAFFDGTGVVQDFSDTANLVQTENWISRLLFVEGTSKTTVEEFTKACQTVRQQFQRPCLVIIDYLQRWSRTKKAYIEMRHNVSLLSGELRDLANNLESPVIAISSQNRSGQGGKDMISLKETGDLEFDADSITFLIKDMDAAQYSDNINRRVKLAVAKNRYGEIRDIPLNFRTDFGTLHEVDPYR